MARVKPKRLIVFGERGYRSVVSLVGDVTVTGKATGHVYKFTGSEPVLFDRRETRYIEQDKRFSITEEVVD